MTTPDAARPLLSLDRVSKRFDTHEAVADVSLALAAGEILCLLGPSGCGKSTLLRLVAGFEAPTGGAIRLDGVDLAGSPPHRRPVNMMFQSYALFPHLTVARNIAYGLSGLGRAAKSARVGDLLRLVRLDGFADRRPDTLSGGQRQRVALARALAREPKVLLLDEPLAALDHGLREETQGELRAIQRRLGTSFIVVTHDPAEAMALADRIGVMDRGRLVQIGDPASLYERPASRFVAGLLGDVNLMAGTFAGDEGGLLRVETAMGPVLAAGEAPAPGGSVMIALRPERIAVSRTEAAGEDASTALTGTVSESTYLGDRIRLRVRLADGQTVSASLLAGGGEGGVAVGAPVRLAAAPGAATVLPA